MARISRVYGEANGQSITFEQEGDVWKADVPWSDDGEYATSIWAEDEAGNTGYICTVLFVISGHELQGYVIPRGYAGSGSSLNYAGLPTISEFLGNMYMQEFFMQKKEKRYQASVQKGGYGIERIVCSRDGY